MTDTECNNSRTVVEGRDTRTGRFLAGNTGNGGRKRGARNKLAYALVDALHEDFTKHGVAAIQRVRVEEPSAYLRIVCSVLPKELDVALNVDVDLFADVESFRQAYAIARRHIGADPPLIEGEAIDGE